MSTRNRGYLLLPVSLALLVLAALALLLNTSVPDGLAQRSAANSIEAAHYAAEAGLAHGLWALDDGHCVLPANIVDNPLARSHYSVTFSGDGSGTVTTTAFSAIADAVIAKDQPETAVEPSGSTLTVRPDAASERRALLRFDLSTIGTGTRIISATLFLHATAPDTRVSQTIHRITAGWGELTATWDTTAEKHANAVAVPIPGGETSASTFEIDLTALVQTWVNGGEPNYGIMIKPAPTSDPAQYASREYATTTLRPGLIVRTTSGELLTTATLKVDGASTDGTTRTLERQSLQPRPRTVRSITVQPGPTTTADGWLTGAKADWNYGNSTLIRASESSGPERGMLRFELSRLIPYGAHVDSATLHLYADTMVGTLNVHGVTRKWTEGDCNGTCPTPGATWSTADGSANWTVAGGDADITVSASAPPGPSSEWVTVDITELARAWVSGARKNYGVQLRGVGGLTLFQSADSSDPTLHPKLTLEYRCPCGTVCVPPQGDGKLLLVVADAANPDTDDQALAERLTGWGYVVTLISDNAAQSAFDTAFASHDLAYVSESVSASELGTKLTAASIGVVLEKAALVDEMQLASSGANPVASGMNVISQNHPITAPLPTTAVDIHRQKTRLLAATGSLAAGATVLGTISGNNALLALDAGLPMTDGLPAAGRRVLLPVGGAQKTNWAYLTTNGRFIMSQALSWARQTHSCTEQSIAVRVQTTADDATEDRATNVGQVAIDDPALALVDASSGGGKQLVGLRFRGLAIPPGAHITGAFVDFTVAATGSVATSLIFNAEDTDNALAFTAADFNISDRPTTDATIDWLALESWDTPGEVKTTPDLSTLIQAIVDRPDWQTWNSLALIVDGSGERSAAAFDGDSTAAPLLRVDFCGEVPNPVELLFVVVDPAGLSVQESAKKALLESWGHAVTLIAANAAQAAFDAALDAATVAFVGHEVDPAVLGTRLTGATIGVVSEEAGLADEFGLSATTMLASRSTINVVDNAHYITQPFAGGAITLLAGAENLTDLTGTLADDLAVLATTPGGPALAALNAGDTLIGGGTAAGRRVQLPWGDAATDINTLTSDGLTIFRRALEWAAGADNPISHGPIAHWALNEASGAVAVDDEGNHDATLSGGTWTGGHVAGSVLLNGTTDHLSVADTNSLDLNSGLTLMGWVRKNSLTGYDLVFDKGDAATEHNYYFGTNGDEITFGFYNDGYVEFTTTSANLSSGSWHHLAATFDNAADSVRLYLDGIETFTGSTTQSPLVNGGQLHIGRGPSGAYFDGRLDDLRIFNYALSDGEIAGYAAMGGVQFETIASAELGSNDTSITVAVPSGVAVGDLLIATVATDGSNKSTLSPPAGWNEIDLNEKSSQISFGVWWKLAGASEPANYTFTWGSNENAYATVMRFSGHDPVDPIHNAEADGGTDIAPLSPAVTTTVSGALIVRLAGFDDDDITPGDPGLAGHTAITMGASGNGGTTVSSGAGYLRQAAPGNSGTSTFTLTATEEYRAVTIAIAPE